MRILQPADLVLSRVGGTQILVHGNSPIVVNLKLKFSCIFIFGLMKGPVVCAVCAVIICLQKQMMTALLFKSFIAFCANGWTDGQQRSVLCQVQSRDSTRG